MPVEPRAVPPSRWADLDGPVHWVDHGGPTTDVAPLVCVHGLGGSHVNWLSLAPLLTPSRRVVALDLPGFGLTQAQGRATTVAANAALLHRFVTEVVGRPVVLVGNSMGGLVSLITAAEHAEAVAGLALIDPAVPPSLTARPDPLVTATFALYSVPGLGAAVVAGRRKVRTAEQLANDTLRLCCVHPERVPPDVVAAHTAMTIARGHYPGLEQEFADAARSVVRTISRRSQFAAMAASVSAPVLLLHGRDDRLVRVTGARMLARRQSGWRYAEAPFVGHVPQLEVPAWTAEQLLGWLPEVPASGPAGPSTGTNPQLSGLV